MTNGSPGQLFVTLYKAIISSPESTPFLARCPLDDAFTHLQRKADRFIDAIGALCLRPCSGPQCTYILVMQHLRTLYRHIPWERTLRPFFRLKKPDFWLTDPVYCVS